MPATNARAMLISNPFRTIVDEDSAVKTAHPGARDVRVLTVLRDRQPAIDENTRQFNIRKIARNRYELTLPGIITEFALGDTITLKTDRFGLDAGMPAIIVRMNIATSANRTIFEVYL